MLDQTGLKGSYDFKFENPSGDPHPELISSIVTSIQGIGLKLKAAKGRAEFVVIDLAQKPSEN